MEQMGHSKMEDTMCRTIIAWLIGGDVCSLFCSRSWLFHLSWGRTSSARGL